MNISIDQKDSTFAELTVNLQESDYAPRVDQKIKEYSKTAQIKGFRPGKVPAGMIRKMYGKGILVDQINELLQEEVNKYIKDNNLRILGDPLPKQDEQENIDWDTQKEFNFKYELGLLPDFELPLDKITVEGYNIEVDDDTINQAYEQMQSQFGKTTNPEESKEGDFLYGELKSTEGEYSTTTLIPTNQAKTNKEKFVGVKPGDTISFDLRETFGDDDNTIKHLTGAEKEQAAELKGNFEFNVEKINRTEAAELDQEAFDKVFGKDVVNSREEFDAKVRETIKENYDREAVNALNNNLVETLINETEIEIPEDFFKRWLEVTNRGKLTREQIEENYDQYKRELKWSLIRNKVVEENDIKVSGKEVEESAMLRMVSQFGMTSVSEEMAENLRGYMENFLRQDNGRNYLNEYETLLTQKVLDKLREKVTVSEKTVTAEEFRNI